MTGKDDEIEDVQTIEIWIDESERKALWDILKDHGVKNNMKPLKVAILLQEMAQSIIESMGIESLEQVSVPFAQSSEELH